MYAIWQIFWSSYLWERISYYPNIFFPENNIFITIKMECMHCPYFFIIFHSPSQKNIFIQICLFVSLLYDLYYWWISFCLYLYQQRKLISIHNHERLYATVSSFSIIIVRFIKTISSFSESCNKWVFGNISMTFFKNNYHCYGNSFTSLLISDHWTIFHKTTRGELRSIEFSSNYLMNYTRHRI